MDSCILIDRKILKDQILRYLSVFLRLLSVLCGC